MNYTILIVDDDMAINDMLVKYLRKNGYITYSAYSGTETVQLAWQLMLCLYFLVIWSFMDWKVFWA